MMLEYLGSGEPPTCFWTTTPIDAAGATDAGFPVNDYLNLVEGTVEAAVRFRHAAIEGTWTVTVRQTGKYALVEREAEQAADPATCPPWVKVELAIDLTSRDCTIAGTLQGWAVVPKTPEAGFSRVMLTGSAHDLRGNVTVKPPSLALPQGLLATFHLIKFDDDSQEARVGLDVDGFYSDPKGTGDTYAEIFESVTPPDGCPAWTTPAGDECTTL